MQINYCLLPNENQIRFAEYLGKRYGEIVKFNYFAIATNPIPQKAYSLPKPPTKKSKRRKKISKPRDNSFVVHYSPLIGGYINEAIPRSTKVLPASRLPESA